MPGKGHWNYSDVQMSSVCLFREVKILSTDFNRKISVLVLAVFNTVGAADFTLW